MTLNTPGNGSLNTDSEYGIITGTRFSMTLKKPRIGWLHEKLSDSLAAGLLGKS
jgi:hypothetical protein